VILTGVGEGLRLAAVHHIGVISRTRSERLGPLIITGPFAVVRNPLYIGNALIWVGFALTARLVWAAPLVAVLIVAEYHAIVRWEERLLESRHGEAYRMYSGRVPRWFPEFGALRRGPRAFSGKDDTSRFSWRETLFSERGTLVAIGMGYVLLWIKARF
jgi:protein-S-isoprenylcysteine O-methyltransferase Ste14